MCEHWISKTYSSIKKNKTINLIHVNILNIFYILMLILLPREKERDRFVCVCVGGGVEEEMEKKRHE